MTNGIYSILQSPDDGSPLDEKLVSKSGIKYEKTKSGILNLLPTRDHLNISIYEHPMYKKWNNIIEKRIEYYTSKKTIAGKLANWSYKSIDYFNNRQTDEFLLDIGCGNGAHVNRLINKSNYIGLDTNTHRLEKLIQQYPEVTPILGDAAFLPFKDNSVKYIFSSNAFEHLWLLKNAVMECHRILKNDGRIVIVIPTEGGMWSLGRKYISKRFFQKNYPEIDFDLISHIEHCNITKQVVRTLETFFEIKKQYIPTRIPSIYFNILVEFKCKKRIIQVADH